jgi:hypothetical protein
LRHLVSRRVGGLHAAARAAIASPTFEDRAGAIELIRDSGEGKLAYLLADAVRSTCRQTRELAADALHDMTARMLDHLNTQPPPTDASVINAQADGLAEAIRTAVQRWELHFQPKVLEAALWMAERVEAAVLEKLQEPQSKIVHVLSEMIEGASDPRLAELLMMQAHELRAERVERESPDEGALAGRELLDAPAHLAGRLVRERDREDAIRSHARLDEARDAVGDDAGLARARAGEHKQSSIKMRRPGALLGVEFFEIDAHGAAQCEPTASRFGAYSRLQ